MQNGNLSLDDFKDNRPNSVMMFEITKVAHKTMGTAAFNLHPEILISSYNAVSYSSYFNWPDATTDALIYFLNSINIDIVTNLRAAFESDDENDAFELAMPLFNSFLLELLKLLEFQQEIK